MKYKRFLLTVLFSSCLLLRVNAQNNVPAAGGEAKGSGGTTSYSVGQLFYTEINNESGSLTQGIQQSYSIEVVSARENMDGINLSVSAYPNPVTDFMILKIGTPTLWRSQSLEYRLYDIHGKLLINKKIVADETRISMSSLKPSVYFIRVIEKNKTLKHFKIIKE